MARRRRRPARARSASAGSGSRQESRPRERTARPAALARVAVSGELEGCVIDAGRVLWLCPDGRGGGAGRVLCRHAVV